MLKEFESESVRHRRGREREGKGGKEREKVFDLTYIENNTQNNDEQSIITNTNGSSALCK